MKLSPEFIDSLMERALAQAEKAYSLGEVPVGAVVAREGKIIAEAHNLTETRSDPTAHAEALVIQAAAQTIGNWRLDDAILCCTLEPCTMCTGATRLARIPVVIFGAWDKRMGAMGTLYDLSIDERLGAVPRVISGVKEQNSMELLQRFFKEKRILKDCS